LQLSSENLSLDTNAIFRAVSGVHRRVRGSYAIVAQICGYGLLAFRDPFGIRPLCLGVLETPNGSEYMVASESVALDGLGFRLVRDIAPGEALFIDLEGRLFSRQCALKPSLNPCIFEYVYLARPDSVMDGVSVYSARLRLGEYLADQVASRVAVSSIDVVMPIPDSSRPAALQLALRLGLPYREGFIKNRYIGRTFIMPGQAIRAKSVRQKLNTVGIEFKGKSVLLVDDSIVRGTTIREIVQMARDAGARQVLVASSAPPVRFPNVYGIDMPTRAELIAADRTEEEVRREIGADALIYQQLQDLKQAVIDCNPALTNFDASCFDGHYITGDVTGAYLDHIEDLRRAPKIEEEGPRNQLSLAIESAEV
jgi:amidophosphoribosyltransferase